MENENKEKNTLKKTDINQGIRSERHGENKLIYLEKLKQFLNHIFFEKKLKKKDVELSVHEMKIAKTLLTKKKLIDKKSFSFTLKNFDKLKILKKKKKNEDELKFVIKKCLKQLQEDFLEKFRKKKIEQMDDCRVSMKEVTRNKNEYFYRHYFGRIAEREGIPIQKFYHFKCWSERYSRNIPRSITKDSLFMWKKNPKFIQKIVDFIKNKFMIKFISFNSKKIRSMVSKWDAILDEKGLEEGTKAVIRSFKSRGLKLPWTLTEVRKAIDNTLSFLT